MKRLLGVLCIFITFSVYAATFLDTENRLWFTDDIVKNAIVEFVPEDKQQSVADLYQDLMDQETGKISIDSLFKVCRKAGFNTYKYEGFTQCKDFIQKMLTDAQIAEEVNIDGFCPGLDENGNNPNKLRSITDKTRIGDFCSSTNIRMGQVIFKPGYNCSCMATVCNEGFEFQGGACVTRVADGNGDCLREVHKKTSENDNLEKCKAFCGNQYTGRACKYTSVVMSHSTGECICNPNSTEIDNALLSMQRAEERRINSLKYYKVCGDDKGKTGGTEICVEGVFNWINVGMLQAAGLAEEYARVRYNDDIACDNNYRTSWNDDYVRCTSKNSKMYYEFQFDDVKESIDADIQRGVILGICKIYNVSVGVKSCATSCTVEMVRTAQHFGLTATTNGNTCNFSGRSISADEAESKLAKIDGIDNYIFYSGIQIQGSKNVITQLKDYIKSTGKTVRSFDCIRNVDEIKNSLLVGDDDVLRCKLNGQPIDFVFDDFSESWLYVQEDGEAKIQCVVSGGKYADQECFGLTQQQCLEANAVFKKKFPSASGMRWNGKECVLLDSAEAQRYDIYVQAGIGVVAAADCLLLTHTGCLVLAVETAGLATELTTKEFIENRAGEFLAVSTRCNNRDCAIDTIRNAGKVLSVMGSLDAAAANSVDSELARLVDYLEPEDLPNVSDNDWDEIIVQLGGDPDDTAGTALVWLNRIGLGAQFASLATSGYRLVSKAITRLANKAARTANTVTDVARATDTATDSGRATGHTGNAGHGSGAAGASGNAADVASEAGRSTGPLHPDIDAYRNSGDRARVRLRAKYHPDKAPSVELREKAQDIFQKIVFIDDMSEDELRALSRLMNEYDNEVMAAREAANAANAASDAGRTTNSASDAGRTTGATSNTTDVTGVTNTTSDVAQTTNATTDATRATTNAATDGARTANATADAARTTSRTTNTATDGTRMFGRTNVDDIGMVNKGWERAVFDGVDRFRHKKITYPEEADDVRRALEATKGQHNLAYMGVKDGYIVIAYESDLERAWPAFNKAVSGMTDAARTTSHATNATSDASRTNRYIKKEIKPFSNYIGGSKEANGVWQVTDTQTGEVLFLKRTTANEIYLTQKASRVNLGSNPIVHIVQESEQNADEIAKALNITVPDYVKADKWLLTKQIPEGDDLMTVVSNGGFLSDGTKITNAEIDQLVSELQKLKSAGVNHSDLYTNTILRRGTNGKLEAYIMDFESAGIHDVNFIARELESIKTIDNSANVARDINFDFFGADIVQKTNRAATLRGGNTRPYNYYFINIDGMVRSDVKKLMDNLKNSGYDDVFLTRDNGKYVVNASNPTIRGGKAIDNSRVQQFEINYISRTKGANTADNVSSAKSGANNAGKASSAANNVQNMSQQQVLNRAVEINNRTYGTSYDDPSWGDTLEMYKSAGLSKLAKNHDVLSGPITKVRGYDVFLEDIPGANGKIGQISGRPIVVVNVNGKKIPFYISTGSAGNGVNKLSVPSGKWEAIFGIEKRTDGAGNFVGSGWFNKGSLSQIENHYGSKELKQIAEALDEKIGDVRDTKLVNTSARRADNGGIGDTAISTLLPDIENSAALDLINESMTNGAQAYNGSTTNFLANVMDIKDFLSKL